VLPRVAHAGGRHGEVALMQAAENRSARCARLSSGSDQPRLTLWETRTSPWRSKLWCQGPSPYSEFRQHLIQTLGLSEPGLNLVMVQPSLDGMRHSLRLGIHGRCYRHPRRCFEHAACRVMGHVRAAKRRHRQPRRLQTVWPPDDRVRQQAGSATARSRQCLRTTRSQAEPSR